MERHGSQPLHAGKMGEPYLGAGIGLAQHSGENGTEAQKQRNESHGGDALPMIGLAQSRGRVTEGVMMKCVPTGTVASHKSCQGKRPRWTTRKTPEQLLSKRRTALKLTGAEPRPMWGQKPWPCYATHTYVQMLKVWPPPKAILTTLKHASPPSASHVSGNMAEAACKVRGAERQNVRTVYVSIPLAPSIHLP